LYDRVLEALRALVLSKKPERVLEVGCGTGYWLAVLRTMSPCVYGLDYSLEMLHQIAMPVAHTPVAGAIIERSPAA